MKVAFCPECEGEFPAPLNLKVGQHITCPHCDAELEVIHLIPLELDWAFDEPGVDGEEDDSVDDQDDWDDQDDGEDEEDWEDEEDEEL